MTLQDIVVLVQGELVTEFTEETNPKISGIASLRDAQAGDLSFFISPRYLTELRKTKATAVLVLKNFKESINPITIKVENPSAAFDLVIAALAPEEIKHPIGIHPQAYVSPKAVLGTGVTVGPFAVVEEGAVIGSKTIIGAQSYVGAFAHIGEDSLIYPHVTIRERCEIGSRVIIHPGAVIGSCGFGYETKGGQHHKIAQTGIVQIEDDVEIGANTTIDRARFGATRIGAGTKIDNLVQIAHNVVIGPHNMICSQVGIAGSTRTGSSVTLAGQVGLSGHLEIGDQAILGAQSGVSKNVPSGAMLIGSPAKPIKAWKENNFYIHNGGKLLDRMEQRVQELEALLVAGKESK